MSRIQEENAPRVMEENAPSMKNHYLPNVMDISLSSVISICWNFKIGLEDKGEANCHFITSTVCCQNLFLSC